MFDFLFDIVFQILLDLVLGFIGEALGELGLHAYERSHLTKVLNPLGKLIWYPVSGIILGLISIAVLPHHLITSDGLRLAGTLGAAIFWGLALCFTTGLFAYGFVDKRSLRWDKFAYGFIFSVAYSLTRNYWLLRV